MGNRIVFYLPVRKFVISRPVRQALLRLAQQALLRQVMWPGHMTYCFLLKQYRGITIENQHVKGGGLC